MSDEIYPGDVIMLLRDKAKKKQSVPCDLLILSGSTVCNEAILTGESLPLVKESIAMLDNSEDQLDVNGAEHRPHLLFSGTEILQFTPSEDVATDCPHLSKPPTDGIICFVLKNGFETKQGKLMRVILFS